MSNADIELIKEMHTYMRPMGSPAEAEFVDRFLKPLGVARDQHLNYFLEIGENPIVLWSSHTDTVHIAEGRQQVHRDGNIIGLPFKSKSSCLGADCTAGIWIMMEMIKANVPGFYVFHHGEERGMIGSRDLALKSPERLKGIKAAIAFDRKGTKSVITHQAKTRTCSDKFGKSLMRQLPKGFDLDTHGIYTDTYAYHEIIPECTNISVGYEMAHSPNECLDMDHLIGLRDHMVKFRSQRIVIERKPEKIAPKKKKYGYSGGLGGDLFGFKSKTVAECTTWEKLCWDFPNDVAAALAAWEHEGLLFEDFKRMVTEAREDRFDRIAMRDLRDLAA
jgi:hypothetical protein